MKTSELEKLLKAKRLTELSEEEREITGCYIGDLLSWVMGRAQTGDVWITIMTNINIVGVAVLADVACIVIPEGTPVEPETLAKANAEGVTIFSCEQSAFACAKQLASL